MKLFQLHEAQTTLKGNPSEIAAIIKRDCSECLAVYKDLESTLIRGEKSMKVKAFASDIRDNRKPLVMPRKQHEALRKAFDELELPVNRSNGLFCTTDEEIADSWGKLYAIFPKDGFQGLIFEELQYGYVYDEVEGQDEAELVDILKALKPKVFNHSGLGEVLRQGYQDILIKASGYYGVALPLPGNSWSIEDKILVQLGLQESED